MKRYRLLLIALFMAVLAIGQQPKKQYIELSVVPTSKDWLFQLGERADFEVLVTKNGKPLENCTISYEIGLEGMPPKLVKEITLKKGLNIIKGMALESPGFLQCKVKTLVDSKVYSNFASAGFQPNQIKPTVSNPEDFDSFWESNRKELAQVPMKPEMILQPELCTDMYDVYHVELQNIKSYGSWRKNSFLYGMLSVPKGEGPFPAILKVPGAGVRSYGADEAARQGALVFKIGIHGIPVNLDNKIYNALDVGALDRYSTFNMDDKYSNYFRRVYMGCIRAVDFIYSLPKFDSKNLIVSGGSQGGALSIVTAALDKRVKGLAVFYPALSDMTGYLEGRVGGWPHVFRNKDHISAELKEIWAQNIAYYDVVNFARRLKVPGWYSWGYNDFVCRPTSTFSAYNVITSKKELHIFEDTGHWTYPEQNKEANQWIMNNLLKD